MSAVTPKTNMPYPLHSNSVLENLIEDEDVEGTLLTLQRWAEKLEAEATTEQLERLKKGLPEDFSIDEKFKIVKNPIRLSTGGGGEAMAPRFLDRNVDLYLVRAQKLVEGKYSYKQIKRAQLSQLYFTLQSLFLVGRKGGGIPTGFTWETKDYDFTEFLKEFIDFRREVDSNFPKIRDGEVELAVKKEKNAAILKKLNMVDYDRIARTAIPLTPILARHEHAWKKMMSKPCVECDVERGVACPNDKLVNLDEMNLEHYSFLGAKIARRNALRKKYSETKKDQFIEIMKRVLLKYYTEAAMSPKKYSEMNLENLFTEEPKFILKIPFACKSRYEMQKSSWNGAIVRSFFPLSERDEKPKKTGARLYFGGTSPPSLLVQNLMADAMKRVLARKLVEDSVRLGIDLTSENDYHRTKDRLLWEYIATCERGTVETKLIDVGYENGYGCHELPILKFTEIESGSQPNSTKVRGKMKHCLQPDVEKMWNWSDSSVKDLWGKLPIVSPNVTLAEIDSIFTSNSEIEGVVICIDHWVIDGDDAEEWGFSDLDTYWGIKPDLFHADEPTEGARTFVTFLKRIIYKSKYDIKRQDVGHSRRAYGVLLKEDLNEFLESK